MARVLLAVLLGLGFSEGDSAATPVTQGASVAYSSCAAVLSAAAGGETPSDGEYVILVSQTPNVAASVYCKGN
jgi:hypothetical protein